LDRAIIDPYDDDDRETPTDSVESVRKITLHRHAKLFPSASDVDLLDLSYEIEVILQHNGRVVLDVSMLEINDSTRDTLSACSWLLQSVQLWHDEPNAECLPVTVKCQWNMVNLLLHKVSTPQV
jgi:hypothetical protein